MPNQGATLSNYEPTLRDRIAWWLSDNLAGGDRGTTNYINEKARGAVDFVPGVGEAVGFDEAKREFDAGNYGKAAIGGGLTALGAVPGLGDAIATPLKGIFAGIGSRTANHSQHGRALDMLDQGRTPQETFLDTGWFSGQDGRMRYEIPDHRSRLHGPRSMGADDLSLEYTGLPQRGVEQPAALDDIFTHPELLEAYPGIRGVNVVEETHPGSLGGFNRLEGPDGTISLRSNAFPTGRPEIDNVDPKSVMLHELQHVIQSIEGFDPGYNTHAAAQRILQQGSFPNATLESAFREMYSRMGVSNPTPRQMKRMFNSEVGQGIARRTAHETYMRNMGEVEARNVEARLRNPDHFELPRFSEDRLPLEQLSVDDIERGIYKLKDVPGLSLRGPAKRTR